MIVDISDRVGRILGAMTPGAGSVWDVSDRAARLAGRTSRGVADSIQAGGVVVAPGALAEIASAGNPAAGVWEIYVIAGLGAGAVLADWANMQVRSTATPIGILALPGPGLVAAFGPYRFSFGGAGTLHVVAVAAGTAAVPYSASIVATRIE